MALVGEDDSSYTGRLMAQLYRCPLICVSGLLQTFTLKTFLYSYRLGFLVVTGACVTIFINCAFLYVSSLLGGPRVGSLPVLFYIYQINGENSRSDLCHNDSTTL